MRQTLIFILGILAGWILRGLAELIDEKFWKKNSKITKQHGGKKQ